MTILVCGGSGFIGSNFIRFLHNEEGVKIINLDLLTYAGNPENLDDIHTSPDYKFTHGDIQDHDLVSKILSDEAVSGIINFAAESHVDRSILNARPFVDTNIKGTLNLLEAAREFGIKRFIQVSTDEVYGSLGREGTFTESSPIAPNSPYSASKASADMLVRSFVKTYGTPAIITRCSNNYGPYQFPEKLIPLMIINALENKPLPVYGDGMNIRDWIHVEDHCRAIWSIFKNGSAGEVYNIGADNELANIDIVKLILEKLDKPESLIEFVKDRPGHDRRYAINSYKLKKELGWKPLEEFSTGIEQTIAWYLDNRQWWERVISGEYKNYYQQQYG